MKHIFFLSINDVQKEISHMSSDSHGNSPKISCTMHNAHCVQALKLQLQTTGSNGLSWQSTDNYFRKIKLVLLKALIISPLLVLITR